jgi:ubiquinone/menaquinone biosynthesis C-methylase UbiE
MPSHGTGDSAVRRTSASDRRMLPSHAVMSTGADERGRRRAHMPWGTTKIIGARSLERDHRRLAALLEPGLRVLDVGCGTGAITRGIAERVGPSGRVVGADVNAAFIAQASTAHAGVPGLTFEVADVHALPEAGAFDIVSAARVLQWLSDPLVALRRMARAARPGGRVLVLDYNHQKIAWRPAPPPAALTFYAAFLRWRAEAGFDNAMADRLAELFTKAGLADVRTTGQHEVVERGDADFEAHAGIWAEVAASRGQQMVEDGAITEAEREAGEAAFRAWGAGASERLEHYLLCVEGVRPLTTRGQGMNRVSETTQTATGRCRSIQRSDARVEYLYERRLDEPQGIEKRESSTC